MSSSEDNGSHIKVEEPEAVGEDGGTQNDTEEAVASAEPVADDGEKQEVNVEESVTDGDEVPEVKPEEHIHDDGEAQEIQIEEVEGSIHDNEEAQEVKIEEPISDDPEAQEVKLEGSVADDEEAQGVKDEGSIVDGEAQEVRPEGSVADDGESQDVKAEGSIASSDAKEINPEGSVVGDGEAQRDSIELTAGGEEEVAEPEVEGSEVVDIILDEDPSAVEDNEALDQGEQEGSEKAPEDVDGVGVADGEVGSSAIEDGGVEGNEVDDEAEKSQANSMGVADMAGGISGATGEEDEKPEVTQQPQETNPPTASEPQDPYGVIFKEEFKLFPNKNEFAGKFPKNKKTYPYSARDLNKNVITRALRETAPVHDYFGLIFSSESKRPPTYYKNYFLPVQKQPRSHQHVKVVGHTIPSTVVKSFLRAPLHAMPLSTIKVRWMLNRRKTIYKPADLYSYLSRCGQIEHVYQLTSNSALVVFVDILSALEAVKTRGLGYPWDPLIADWLEPQMNDRGYLNIYANIEENPFLDKTDPYNNRHHHHHHHHHHHTEHHHHKRHSH